MAELMLIFENYYANTNVWNYSFQKTFKNLVVWTISALKHSANAMCFISDKALVRSLNIYKNILFAECGISNSLIQESPEWEETQRKDWPWIVHFKIDYSSWISMPVYGCIGVILNENWVITAHHCATDNDLVVKTNIGESYKVKKTFQPCDSYSANCKSDLALIKLAKPIKFTLSVRPICLPKASALTAALKDRSKTLAMVLLKENEDIMKKTVRIGRPKDCTARSFNSRTMICAGSRKDTCPPDSGSPLMFSSREHGRHHVKYLGGILSWGRDLFEGECESQYSYLAYNDLRKHGSWIRRIINAQ